ncbi:hypothetical protein ACFLYK_04625 [Candidatus Cloacimonadota bacterium]
MITPYNDTEEMTASEKIQAVNNIKTDLENNFVILGQLLSEIRRQKIFRYKGYKNFTEFVENEFNLSGSFAGKVIGAYDLFIKKLDVDETSVKNIGLDKLTMIKPLVKDLDQVESEEWIRKAEEIPASELREEIKEIRKKKKDKTKTMKEVLIEQYLENMVTFFNCSRKELNFKLAIFFQDEDLEKVREVIELKQRNFQETDQL